MNPLATQAEVEAVTALIAASRLTSHVSRGAERTIVGVIGVSDDKETLAGQFAELAGVDSVVPISKSYKLVSREGRDEPTVVRLRNGVTFGGETLAVAAGPCSVESREQLFTTAESVSRAGANLLRGGAFKPRTSPYAFQGMGLEGLVILREAADEYGLLVITEVMEISQIEPMLEYIDCFQVGARNMQNFNLLRELGHVRKPVCLKRGIAATIEEVLLSAEYILSGGNYDLMLCERGIRTFETYTRNTMDVSAIPVLKKLSHLPVVADPSHGVGKRDLVPPMALASVAAGADGLLMEMHPNPDKAMSDGAQSLYPEQLKELVAKLRQLAPVVDRSIAPAVAQVHA